MIRDLSIKGIAKAGVYANDLEGEALGNREPLPRGREEGPRDAEPQAAAVAEVRGEERQLGPAERAFLRLYQLLRPRGLLRLLEVLREREGRREKKERGVGGGRGRPTVLEDKASKNRSCAPPPNSPIASPPPFERSVLWNAWGGAQASVSWMPRFIRPFSDTGQPPLQRASRDGCTSIDVNKTAGDPCVSIEYAGEVCPPPTVHNCAPCAVTHAMKVRTDTSPSDEINRLSMPSIDGATPHVTRQT